MKNNTKKLFFNLAIILFLNLFIKIDITYSQVAFNNTYPIRFEKNENGLRNFPKFNIRQVDGQLSFQECIDNVSSRLLIDEQNGRLIRNLALLRVPCGSLTLSNGASLAITPTVDGYALTKYRTNGAVLWTKTYNDIPFFLTQDHLFSDANTGFYMYDSNTALLRRYNAGGNLTYETSPVELEEEQEAQLIKVAPNGDLYLRIGHLGGNDASIEIAKINGANGQLDWKQHLMTTRNLAKDTRIGVAADESVVAVVNNYGIITGNHGVSGGWDLSVLNVSDGKIIFQDSKLVLGNSAVVPLLVQNKGLFMVEEQFIINEEMTEDETGFSLYHYENDGSEPWKKPIFPSRPFASMNFPQFEADNNGNLLLIGTRTDSLWVVKLGTNGNVIDIIDPLYAAHSNPVVEEAAAIVEADALPPVPEIDNSFTAFSVGEVLHLQVQQQQIGHTTFYIYDSLGKLMKQQDFELTGGAQELKMNIAHLKTGIYFIQQLETGQSEKFMFQK